MHLNAAKIGLSCCIILSLPISAIANPSASQKNVPPLQLGLGLCAFVHLLRTGHQVAFLSLHLAES